MRKILMACVIPLVLSACSPMTVREIREQSAPESFIVQKTYQSAYRALLEEMRRCFQIGMITAAYMVQGDLYHDIRKGEISVTLVGALGPMPMLLVDIQEAGPDAARIDVINKPGQTSITPRIQGFFDNVPVCR